MSDQEAADALADYVKERAEAHGLALDISRDGSRLSVEPEGLARLLARLDSLGVPEEPAAA